MSPGCHRSHGAGRTVAVIDFQTQIFARKIGLYPLEPFRSLTAQNAFAGTVTGQWMSDEIVGGCVTDVLLDAGIYITQINEPGWQHIAAGGGAGCEENCGQEQIMKLQPVNHSK